MRKEFSKNYLKKVVDAVIEAHNEDNDTGRDVDDVEILEVCCFC